MLAESVQFYISVGNKVAHTLLAACSNPLVPAATKAHMLSEIKDLDGPFSTAVKSVLREFADNDEIAENAAWAVAELEQATDLSAISALINLLASLSKQSPAIVQPLLTDVSARVSEDVVNLIALNLAEPSLNAELQSHRSKLTARGQPQNMRQRGLTSSVRSIPVGEPTEADRIRTDDDWRSVVSSSEGVAGDFAGVAKLATEQRERFLKLATLTEGAAEEFQVEVILGLTDGLSREELSLLCSDLAWKENDTCAAALVHTYDVFARSQELDESDLPLLFKLVELPPQVRIPGSTFVDFVGASERDHSPQSWIEGHNSAKGVAAMTLTRGIGSMKDDATRTELVGSLEDLLTRSEPLVASMVIEGAATFLPTFDSEVERLFATATSVLPDDQLGSPSMLRISRFLVGRRRLPVGLAERCRSSTSSHAATVAAWEASEVWLHAEVSEPSDALVDSIPSTAKSHAVDHLSCHQRCEHAKRAGSGIRAIIENEPDAAAREQLARSVLHRLTDDRELLWAMGHLSFVAIGQTEASMMAKAVETEPQFVLDVLTSLIASNNQTSGMVELSAQYCGPILVALAHRDSTRDKASNLLDHLVTQSPVGLPATIGESLRADSANNSPNRR